MIRNLQLSKPQSFQYKRTKKFPLIKVAFVSLNKENSLLFFPRKLSHLFNIVKKNYGNYHTPF